MTPIRSRTIALAIATLVLGTLAAGPALGALSASPNPSTTGSYTVSDSSPPTLPADSISNLYQYLNTYNLVETPSGGTAQSHNLGRGPVSKSFSGKSAGTYAYQLQTCVDTYQFDGLDFVHLSTVCTDTGSSLTVTVAAADLTPDFGTASVPAKSWTQNTAITAFTVPAATGGDAPLSYSASGLPSGVSMSSARRVTGTPTSSGSGSATVAVRDKDGDTDTLTFTWTVAAADLTPDFGTASVPAKSWTQNTAITAFTVPAATGGDAPLSYSASGLPSGVSMSSARRVTGTPTATGSGTATVTVRDKDGDTDTLTFSWTVATAPPDRKPDYSGVTVTAKSWTRNVAVTAFTVPAATGGDAPLSYTASGLPTGVSMSSARRVTGTPTATGSGTATVTVRDKDGDTDTLTFTWAVAADVVPDFGTASVAAKSWTRNVAITAFTAPAATGGNAPLSYTASGLPSGVSMSSARRVTGTPTSTGTGTATVTVTDNDGDTDTLTFTWAVAADVEPDFGTASVPAKSWTRNAAITAFTVPPATGGNAPLSYTASGLPTGVSMSSARSVTGTPTAAGTGTATVTVTDNDGDTDTLTFNWTVVAPTGSLTASPNPSGTGSYTVSNASPPALPADQVTNLLQYLNTYNLVETPSGGAAQSHNLGRGPVSKSFTGKSVGTYAYQLQTCVDTYDFDGSKFTLRSSVCTNSGSSLTVTVTGPDLKPDFGTASVPAKNWIQNSAIAAFTVPAATGGDAPLSYAASGLPTGVSMSSARRVTGTPTASGSGTATVTVTDKDGDTDTLTFSWTVEKDLAPTFGNSTVPAKSWTQNTAITAFTVPDATSGNVPLSYMATGLPSGVSMSNSTRQISGTPTAKGSGNATVTVTDKDGDTDTLTFGWKVEGPNLIPTFGKETIPAQSWRQNVAITPFTAPAATGGDAPLSYTDSGLPTGVSMSSARLVSGTPTALGTGTATVTATDNDDDTATLQFTWTVGTNAVPTFGTSVVPAKSWTYNSAITAFTVPAATGGDGTLSYTASGLPTGVSMSSARSVSGTPTSTGTGTATITATDTDGDTASLTFGWTVTTVVASLSASPNPSGTGSYTVSHASPPALPTDQVTNVLQYLHAYNLVETPSGGTAKSHNLNKGPVSKSFTGKSSGTYAYQLQICKDTYEFDGSDFTLRSSVCTNSGSSLSVTVDLVPDYSGVTVVAKKWKQNEAITAFTVSEATGGDTPLSYTASGLPDGVSMTGKRQFTGTPKVAGSGTATVTAKDKDGDTATLTFSWTVDKDLVPVFNPDTLAAKNWTRNGAIAEFTVPEATGGDAPLSYEDEGLPSGVTMSDARVVSGTPAAAGSGKATITVTDKDGDTDELTFDWTVTLNRPPVANAGAAQTVTEGAKVTLDGTGSSDPNGDTLTYAWTQTSTGTTVTLTGADTASPTFTAPDLLAQEVLRFSLTVNDGTVNSAASTVDITINADNDAPTADAGNDQTVSFGQQVTLDGTASSDPEGQALQYQWSLTTGTGVTLSSTTASSPTFTAPSKATTLVFTLSVKDAPDNTAVTDTVTITVVSTPPIPGAISGPDKVTVGAYTLSWTASDTSQSVVYELQRKIGNQAWTLLSGTDGTTTRSITGHSTPGPRSFRVRACVASDRTNCSAWTAAHTVTFLPPGALIASPASSTTGDYTVRWTPVTGAAYYRLLENTGGKTWQLVRETLDTVHHFTGRTAGTYRYQIEMCFNNPLGLTMATLCWESNWSPITVTVSHDTEPGLQSSTVAGTLAYDAGVTRGGDAYVNIPIEPVPGVNGLEPMLSIDYSGGRERTRSAASLPGDTLGYGWHVSGFSTIRRCIKNQAADATLGIDDNASLCLDGEPLVKVSGTHMTSGAQYRTLRESFARVEIKGPTGSDRKHELWFEVKLPDGSVRQYGNSEESRLRHMRYVPVTGTNRTTESPTAVYLWSINRHTDAFGNTMEYSYLEDERNAIRHPARISYGAVDSVTRAHDAVISFKYVPRSDLSAVNLGTVVQRQDLRLHAIEVNLDSRTVRTYRFKSATTTENWRRLEKIQLCGYDTTGKTAECLEPVSIEWMKPTRTTPGTLTAVSKITDPLGRYTAFDYDTLTASGTHTFLFTEKPFGTPVKPSEVAALTPAPETAPTDGGALKSLVTRVRRSNGIGGEHSTGYAYNGRGFVSTRHWGYLGFYATRETDAASGVVTYNQYRLDYPYFGELAAVHQYEATYSSSARVLSKRAMDHAKKTVAHGNSVETELPFVERATDWHYEGATALGATQRVTQITLQSSLVGTVTETVTTGHSVTSSGAGTVWGDQPTYAVGGVQRKTVSTVTLSNLTSSGQWLIGFASRVNVAHHKGASATAEHTQSADFTRIANTNRVDTETRFSTDAQYRLVTDYGYTTGGLLNSVKVSGANVTDRTTSVSSFSNGRYPASVSNALKHSESFSYDARFGLPTRHTDANSRVVQVTYDAFGREKTRTTPDGVVITSGYGTCPSTGVTCPSVAGVTPAMWISTDSSISPKTVEYLDVLGRVIHTEVEAFTGTDAYRTHTIFDNQGRVKSVSEPYTSASYKASAPKTSYTYDKRDRIKTVTPADGGSTAITYAAQTNNQVKVTVTETLSGTATGTPTTQTTERYYNVLGELVKTVDGHGASAPDTVTTTYTYDSMGLADKVTVGGMETDFDHDVAGNRSRVDHPNHGVVTFAYTALGELRQKIDPAGTTTNSYDVLGRLTKRKDPDGVAQWSHDPANAKGAVAGSCYYDGKSANGSVPACRGQPGFKETLAYNAQARLESSTRVLRAGGYAKTYVHRYTYDTNGRPLTTVHPTGLTAKSVYNARGYLESIRDNAAANTAPALERYGSLNARGQATQETYANGVATTRAFDADSGRLTGIDTVKGSTKLQDNDYAWQSNGILRSRVSHRGGASAKSETFRYDALDRLKSAAATLTGNAAGRTLSMSYDKLGNLKGRTSSVSGDAGASAYVYGSGATGQPSRTTLKSVSIGGVGHTLTHDTSGRVTKYDSTGDDRYLGWNGRHLATTVTVGDSLADTTPKAKDEFRYGPHGARYYKKSTWEVVDPATNASSYSVEHMFYAGGHREVIRVGDATNKSVATSSVTATVLHVRTTPVGGSATTAFEYLHRDHLGSVESATDGAGAELKLLAYDPFGSRRHADWSRSASDAEREALAGEAPQRTARGYTGHEHLERTGLIHMNGRVYDPVIGRFLSPDPVVADASFGQSWNAYSYALNSPLSYSDPTGYSIETRTIYGDRSWDSASLGMLESLLWSTFHHLNRVPLYFHEYFDAQTWNADGFQGSAPVPMRGAVGVGGEMGPADSPMGFASRMLDFVFPSARAQEALTDVIGNPAMDKVADEALAKISLAAPVEYAGTIELVEGEYVATEATRGSENEAVIQPTLNTVAVYHTHVRPRSRTMGDRSLARARRWPGPGDNVAVARGYPNYYRGPRGNVRVLEQVQGRFRVRTLPGYQTLPGEQAGEGVYCPSRYCGRN